MLGRKWPGRALAGLQTRRASPNDEVLKPSGPGPVCAREQAGFSRRAAARVAGLFRLTANLSASSHNLAPSIATPLNDDAASLAATLPAPFSATLPAPFSTALIAVTTTKWIDANAAAANLK